MASTKGQDIVVRQEIIVTVYETGRTYDLPVTVAVNISAIARDMAYRANKSKAHKATGQHGSVVVRPKDYATNPR